MVQRSWAALLALTAAFAVGACSSNNDADAPSSAAPSTPAPISDGPRPSRVISLSPSATETLFAIGAGEQVVAVDNQSNYPPEAPKTDLSGFTPNIEAILSYEPDLVIASDDMGGLVGGMEQANVPIRLMPAPLNLDDLYQQVRDIGMAVGRDTEADSLASDMKSQIDEAIAAVPQRDAPVRYYEELDPTGYAITDSSLPGSIYQLMGLKSVAEGPGGSVQMNSEALLAADPDLILLADTKCCDVDSANVALRPGWGDLRAVKDNRVLGLDDDIASRWGPRVVDLVKQVSDIVSNIPAPVAS
jgi:iron complex transport system substrate-binding protein